MRTDMRRLVLLIVVAMAAAIGSGAEAARVSVADGDSFEIGGKRYRLHDVDAPELYQNCTDGKGRRWPCGRRARDELRRLIGRSDVDCTEVTRDRFGRIVATCKAGGRDLGEAMVRAGFATAYRQGIFAGRYGEAEREARERKRGIWSGDFETPRQWRDAHPRDGTTYEQGDIVPRAVQDWLRRASEAFGRKLGDWFTGRP